jgi:hypothetical protein
MNVWPAVVLLSIFLAGRVWDLINKDQKPVGRCIDTVLLVFTAYCILRLFR